MNSKLDSSLVDRLSAYIDGALSDAETTEIEALISRDVAVAEELAALREVDAAIGSAFEDMLDTPLPLALVRGIENAPAPVIAPLAANQPAPPRWGLGSVAAALALLMFGAGAGSVVTHALSGSPEQIAVAPGWLDQVAEYHRIYAQQKRHLVEVPASDAEHLQSWLANTTGVTFAIPDLSEMGLTFEGARLLVASGKPVGQLMYTTLNGQVVALCFIAGGDAAADNTQTVFTNRNFDDIDMVVWADQGASYVVVGPSSGIDLDEIAQLADVTL